MTRSVFAALILLAALFATFSGTVAQDSSPVAETAPAGDDEPGMGELGIGELENEPPETFAWAGALAPGEPPDDMPPAGAAMLVDGAFPLATGAVPATGTTPDGAAGG